MAYSKDWEDDWPMKYEIPRVRPSRLVIPDTNVPAEATHNENLDKEDFDATEYIGTSIRIASLIAENILSHPFVVLRRQCQVHHSSGKKHLFPFTLVPVTINLVKAQGLGTVWKGLGSTLEVKGLSIGLEEVIAKLLSPPKKIKLHSSLKSVGQSLLFKCVVLVIMTPYYSTSLVETVQSDIASEKPGFIDVFKNGICRLLSWGGPQKGRMLPIWTLLIPTITYSTLKYIFGMVIENVVSHAIHLKNRFKQEKRGALQKNVFDKPDEEIEMTSAFIGMMSADIICYPLETLLYRLYLQGTRTIVDDLDTGREVIPVLTSYEGLLDCYETTISQEGVLGLYKGFGALILQYAVHWAIIKFTKVIVTKMCTTIKPLLKPKPPKSSKLTPDRNIYSASLNSQNSPSNYPQIYAHSYPYYIS